METELKYYLLLFFVSAILGWCLEVVCKQVQLHRFINRGFLIGPYCPIYGVGAVSVTLLLSRYEDSPFAVFGLAILICGTLEYVTSFLMEKLFHARWWDYTGRRFQLNGRVSADTLVPFGLLGLVMIYCLKPWFFNLLSKVSMSVLDYLCVILCVMMITDTGISSWALIRIRVRAEHVEGDSTEAITAAVHTLLQKESAVVRRALHAFPDAQIYNSKLVKSLKEKRLLNKAE